MFAILVVDETPVDSPVVAVIPFAESVVVMTLVGTVAVVIKVTGSVEVVMAIVAGVVTAFDIVVLVIEFTGLVAIEVDDNDEDDAKVFVVDEVTRLRVVDEVVNDEVDNDGAHMASVVEVGAAI